MRFRDFLSEKEGHVKPDGNELDSNGKGYEPRSGDEARFITKHKIQLKPYPVKNEKDRPFKADMPKDKSKAASYEPGEDERVYESVEDLQELSKKLLGRYIHKAAGYGVGAGAAIATVYDSDKRKHLSRNINNRIKGIGSATKCLTKEDTDLQELSKDILRRYAEKAEGSRKAAGEWRDLARKDHKDDNSNSLDKAYYKYEAQRVGKKALKRGMGIALARSKMSKEK